MREMAYRAYMKGRVTAGSVESYVDYCERVERELGVDLDSCDLSEAGRDALRARLLRAGVNTKSAGNCMTALAHYARMTG